MALSYATATVVGLNNVYDALATFMVTAGWTLSDTITTRDKIFKSTGTDGKVNMVFRIANSTEASNPFLYPFSPHKIFPWIFVQGYGAWDSVGHTGSKIYGQVGPWIVGNSSTSGIQPDNLHIHRFNGTPPLVSPADTALLGRTRRIKTADCYENSFFQFDGRRKLWGVNSATVTQLGWSDLSHGEANLSSGGIPPTGLNNCCGILVHDAPSDKDFYYILNNQATLATQWLRYDIETNTWATMAAPIWTASSPTGSVCCWDGADTIYALHGNSTTEFAKYSISGNSWTTLTASPVARSSSWTNNSTANVNNMCYVPNSITGLGQDVIYVMLANSGTVIYRYDVTSNAWRSTSGTGALTSQQSIGGSTFLATVGSKLYSANTSTAPGTWYRADLTQGASIDSSWVSFGSVQSALRNYTGMVGINHIPAKVRSHASFNTTYWFLGNADSITVITKVGAATNHYYWMTFGRFNGSNRTDIMTASAPISGPAGQLSIAVDDTSKYFVGDPIIIWDPANGNAEVTSIFSIVDSTHFKANVVGSYGTGSRIGIDPTQWFAGGNGMALCPTDPKGVGNDNETAEYVMESLPSADVTALCSPGASGLYQPVPISIFNTDAGTVKRQVRGFINNTFSLSTGAYPNIQPEETIKVGGKTYIFFNDTETIRYTVDTRGVLIGPID